MGNIENTILLMLCTLYFAWTDYTVTGVHCLTCARFEPVESPVCVRVEPVESPEVSPCVRVEPVES